MFKYFPLLSIAVLLSLCSAPINAESIRVAIIIDDIGYRQSDHQALTLPGAITYSILPHTPFGKKLALAAKAQQREVMLHIPMEAENGKRLGPGGLTRAMNEHDIHASLTASLAEIPFAIGINNHMGSYLTKQTLAMTSTMNFLKENNLFFLDSKTSPKSKASDIAKTLGVPVRNRHIFLDNELSAEYITQQFDQMIKKAQQNKIAIAIGHPHPETVKMLKDLIPTLKQHNIELVPISSFYKHATNNSDILTISE
ncbi:MAG: divergent polysaccharide deacetylase family protein [Colwellia sp.]